METVKQIKSFVVAYLVLIVFLLLCVAATPFLIRHGLAIRSHLVIQEEFLETSLLPGFELFSLQQPVGHGFKLFLMVHQQLSGLL